MPGPRCCVDPADEYGGPLLAGNGQDRHLWTRRPRRVFTVQLVEFEGCEHGRTPSDADLVGNRRQRIALVRHRLRQLERAWIDAAQFPGIDALLARVARSFGVVA